MGGLLQEYDQVCAIGAKVLRPACPGVVWKWRSGTDGGSGQPEVQIGTQRFVVVATTLSTEVSKKPLFSPKKHYLLRGFQKYD